MSLLDNSKECSKDQNHYNISFKIILLGDSGVGKSSIISRYTTDKFSDNIEPTLGIAYSNKIIETKQKNKINLEIWDTAGQERFKNIAPIYYRKASAIVLVYDITNIKSFESLKFWLDDIEQKGNPHCFKLLVGNKLDLSAERNVSTDTSEKFCEKNQIELIETSAKTNINISNLFKHVAKKLVKRYKSHSEDIQINNIKNINKNQQFCC